MILDTRAHYAIHVVSLHVERPCWSCNKCVENVKHLPTYG